MFKLFSSLAAFVVSKESWSHAEIHYGDVSQVQGVRRLMISGTRRFPQNATADQTTTRRRNPNCVAAHVCEAR